MQVIHVDGGSFSEPPLYKFHDAYFSIVSDSGEMIHFEENIGDVWSGIAEYEAIKWATENIPRPMKIYSDCETAISWARKGSTKKSKFRIAPLDLKEITLEYRHDNYADQWNAINHSPKKDKKFYVERWKESKTSQSPL